MATSVTYTALLTAHQETALFLAGLLNSERARRGTRRDRRAVGCFHEAVLVLRWFLEQGDAGRHFEQDSPPST